MSALTELAGALLYDEPEAYAIIEGTENDPLISGKAALYSLWQGTLVSVLVTGLPKGEGTCRGRMFGFHLHDENGHYNPDDCPHPMHAGDFPVLLGNNGCAVMSFYTDRFYPDEVVGKTLVIHEKADDYRSQPSGDSGEKIAVGTIVMTEKTQRQ